MNNIIIAGTGKCCGKSTIAAGISNLLSNYNIIDSDMIFAKFDNETIILDDINLAKEHNSKIILVVDDKDNTSILQILGTLSLLNKDAKNLIVGTIINNSILNPLYIDKIEKIINLPVLGIIPHFDSPENTIINPDNIKITIINTPNMVLTDDIAMLDKSSQINLLYSDNSTDFNSDLYIISDTTNPIYDCQYLINTGIAKMLANEKSNGKYIIAIGGGYLMTSDSISDKFKSYSAGNTFTGLQLLPVKTVMEEHRTTYEKQATITANIGLLLNHNDEPLIGSEINMGYTAPVNNKKIHPAINIKNSDNPYYGGVISLDGKILGTNLSQLFQNKHFTDTIIRNIMKVKGVDFNGITEINTNEETAMSDIIKLVKSKIDINKIHKILKGATNVI